MQKSRNKIIAILTALLMLAPIASIAFASAHTPAWPIPTTAFIAIAPNPTGPNQTVVVSFWLDKATPTTNGVFGDRWSNFSLSITTPDGKTSPVNLGAASVASSLGGSHYDYTPQVAGNYTFFFSFPGQTLTGGYNPLGQASAPQTIGDYALPSNTSIVLTVLQNPVAQLPDTPLPTSYWQRPIYGTNTLWSSISGNWLGLAANTFASTGQYNSSGSFNPYTTAPNAPHIIWTAPTAPGGQIGGEFAGTETSNFMTTSIMQPKFAPIIMNGILYYTDYPGASSTVTGWTALNLRTGQVVWTVNTTQVLKMGEIYNINSIQEYGGFALLYDTNYNVYDATTGQYIDRFYNPAGSMPGMTIVEASDGGLLGYYVNATDNTLNVFNTTHAFFYPTLTSISAHMEQTFSPARLVNISISQGIMWSEPIVSNISGVPLSPLPSISKIAGNIILVRSVASTTGSATWSPGWEIEAGYSADTGALVWGPVNRTVPLWDKVSIGPALDGVFTIYDAEQSAWWGYNLYTGAQIWGPTVTPHNAYSNYGENAIPAYGNIYAWDFGGYVNCINLQTGVLEWTWNTGSASTNTPYGVWPLWTFAAGTVADGKVFIGGGHMYDPPLNKGSQLYCINATSGQLIWNILSFDTWASPAIVDGTMITWNCYDGQIYAYGQGPTKMTINAPNIGVTTATPITITGTIMDNSPGTKQTAQAANFPNGVPCVSDASQSSWMEYLYMQQPAPYNVTGVPVTLSVVDSNGNPRTIGTTTSDTSGTYAFTWTPDILGNYTLTASFAGSQSYYGSSAETYIYASNAPPASATPTAAPLSVSDTYFVPAIAGLFILVIVSVAVLALLMLRKRS